MDSKCAFFEIMIFEVDFSYRVIGDFMMLLYSLCVRAKCFEFRQSKLDSMRLWNSADCPLSNCLLKIDFDPTLRKERELLSSKLSANHDVYM